eukprot:scaffold2484_cov261-Pinguiococcus_pyrenoidosus.AAC.1
MDSMNNIEAQRRLKVARTYMAEAEKLAEVKSAEARAEATYLLGVGVSRQRSAIQDGFNTMVDNFAVTTGLSADTVRALIYTTQFFDSSVGMVARGTGVPNRLFLSHAPDAVLEQTRQLHSTLGSSYLDFTSFPTPEQQAIARRRIQRDEKVADETATAGGAATALDEPSDRGAEETKGDERKSKVT